MSGSFTLFPADAPPVSIAAHTGRISVVGSAEPWVLSSIWRAAVSHAALQRGYQDRSHASETVSGAHLRVMIEGLSWLLPINPFEPFVSDDSIGAFLGIESLILEIAVQIGGWRCPSCEGMVFRDSIPRMADILSTAGEGTVVCVVPRGKESPPLRQLAEFRHGISLPISLTRARTSAAAWRTLEPIKAGPLP